MMNKDNVLFHLREAAEELTRTIAEIEQDTEYDAPEFSVAMQHLYHHLNTAWNTRAVALERLEKASDQDFNAWCGYPKDLPLLEV